MTIPHLLNGLVVGVITYANMRMYYRNRIRERRLRELERENAALRDMFRDKREY